MYSTQPTESVAPLKSLVLTEKFKEAHDTLTQGGIKGIWHRFKQGGDLETVAISYVRGAEQLYREEIKKTTMPEFSSLKREYDGLLQHIDSVWSELQRDFPGEVSDKNGRLQRILLPAIEKRLEEYSLLTLDRKKEPIEKMVGYVEIIRDIHSGLSSTGEFFGDIAAKLRKYETEYISLAQIADKYLILSDQMKQVAERFEIAAVTKIPDVYRVETVSQEQKSGK